MSKVFFSAFMFALLCTGNLSLDHVQDNSHLQNFNMQTMAHYQVLNQNVSADMQDDLDDEDEEQNVQ